MIGMIWKRRRRKAVDEQKVENKAPTTLTTNKGKIKKRAYEMHDYPYPVYEVFHSSR